MSCKRLRDIRQREKAQPIEIRVLKKWMPIHRKNDLKSKNAELCYQFVDIHGDAIEATADANDVEYFDSIIRLYLCYKVTGYICSRPRSYMATVDHVASVIIGRKAKFIPLKNSGIPTVYFNFASYDLLIKRNNDKKLLTDYIGRVENNSLRPTSKGETLRKLLLQDEWKKQVEITLWPEMKHLVGDEVMPGDIIAITSTKVSKFNISISSIITNSFANTYRLRALPAMQTTNTIGRQVTIHELKQGNLLNNQGFTNLKCHAKVTEIQAHRGWYYVRCSKCTKELYPEEDGPLEFVCKDDNDIVPNFMYSMNAVISDSTGTTNVTFCDEGMTALLNIRCEELVMKERCIDSKKLPHQMVSIIGVPKLLHLTIRNDAQIVVNNITEPQTTFEAQSATQEPTTSHLSPTTPNPKLNITKRLEHESLDTSHGPKRIKE